MTPREEELSQQVELLRRENALLRQKIDLLVKRVFGSSSEQLDPAQMRLLLQGPEAAAPVVDAPSVAPKATLARSFPCRKKPRLPENLPVVEEVLDPDAVKAQPQAWRCIG